MKTGVLCATAASLLGVLQLSGIARAADASSTPTQAAGATEGTLEEVIVTALRREQTLESTPAAISVLQGAELANLGITNPQDLANTLPNIQNGVAGFAIRGIGSGDDTEKGDPSTAFSLDGINIARPQLQTLAMYDIDRVEVLRGPQGTLYGRNSTAGAVNVISASPVDHYDAYGTLEAGNHSTQRATGMVNIPFSDAVALRVAATYNKHDGYTPSHDGSTPLDGQDELGARAKLLVHAGSATTILLSGDYARKDDTGPARLPLNRVLNGTTALSGDSSLYYQSPGADGYYRLNTRGLTLEIKSDLGFAELDALTGYRNQSETDLQLFMDLGGNQGVNHINGDQISQEIRLASRGDGKLQWVTGLYYFKEHTDTAPVVTIPAIGLVLNWDLHAHADSKAAFAQATYSVLPTLRLVGGLRYTEDAKDRVGTFTFFPFDAKTSSNKLNWKGGLEYDIAQRVLFYASVATGYKSAGFNDGNPNFGSALYYNPENLTDIEAGLKGRFLDNKLYLSLSAFNYDYKDLQLDYLPPTGGKVTRNAAKATVRGLEAEGNLRVLEHGQLDFSLSLLDAKYDHYVVLAASPPAIPSDVLFDGYSLDRSPKTTYRVAYRQDFPVGPGNIRATAAAKYSSSYYVSDFGIPVQYTQPSFWRTDLSLGYFGKQDRWSVQAFVRNLEDKRQLGLLQFGTFQLTDPRQYGVRVHVGL